MNDTHRAPDLAQAAYAMVYVDVPNILKSGSAQNSASRLYFELDQIDWEALVRCMLESLHPQRVVPVGAAYVLVGKDRPQKATRLSHLRDGLGKYRSILDVVGTRGDVDSKIIIDMWADVIELSQELSRKGRAFPHELTILLASGDHIYSDAVTRIREVFEGKIDLKLHVFSWQRSLSGTLEQAGQRVAFLDQCPPYFAVVNR